MAPSAEHSGTQTSPGWPPIDWQLGPPTEQPIELEKEQKPAVALAVPLQRTLNFE